MTAGDELVPELIAGGLSEEQARMAHAFWLQQALLEVQRVLFEREAARLHIRAITELQESAYRRAATEADAIMRTLWEQATTIKERSYILLTQYPEGYWRLDGMPSEATLQERIHLSRRDPERRERLSVLPIGMPNALDLTLHPGLQDLANILSLEADEAFYAEYYPRMPDVDVSPRHVKRVMEALQREMNREATRRKRVPVYFTDLPWERQCALAERRRYWFGQFGITPRNWKKGTWSLWRLKDIPLPEEVKARFH